MKEKSACMMCGYRCHRIDLKNGSRILEDEDRNLYFNRQPIKDCMARARITKGLSQIQARKMVAKGERL